MNPEGSLRDLPASLRKAFSARDGFDPMPQPGPHDWLTHHKESGQTYDEYVDSRPVQPDAIRHVLYIQPIGEFTVAQKLSLLDLEEFAGSYFSMDVKTLPVLSLRDYNFTTRVNEYTGKGQILTRDILSLLKENMPEDAYCVLAITMEDLYPDPEWNFVFGEASVYDRVGVFSFARYDPAFFGEPRPEDYEKLLLLRSCKVLAHEIGHMFGLHHCIFYHCCMNGSNHLEESDKRPIHLCPVCLRKLYHSIGFEIYRRYEDLSAFYKRTGLEKEEEWVTNRLKTISK